MSKRAKNARTAALFGLILALSFAAPAAAAYFESNLSAWQGKTWVAAGTKYSSSRSYYIELSSSSPAGGHFWVDDGNGNYIGAAIDVYSGNQYWSAYQGDGRYYSGYATLYGRELGYGPIVDTVKGWQNLNG